MYYCFIETKRSAGRKTTRYVLHVNVYSWPQRLRVYIVVSEAEYVSRDTHGLKNYFLGTARIGRRVFFCQFNANVYRSCPSFQVEKNISRVLDDWPASGTGSLSLGDGIIFLVVDVGRKIVASSSVGLCDGRIRTNRKPRTYINKRVICDPSPLAFWCNWNGTYNTVHTN